MAHIDPARHHEWVIAFAIRTEDAGIYVVDAVAEMLVKGFVEMVIPLNGAGVED
jgi:hypothetical protein